MDDILKLLKDAYEKLIALHNEARAIAADALTAKNDAEKQLGEIKAKWGELQSMEAQLKNREAKVAGIEDLVGREAVLNSERSTFLTFRDKESTRLENLKKELAEQQGQIELRKEKLAKQTADLEKEKAEYRDKIKAEIKAALGA